MRVSFLAVAEAEAEAAQAWYEQRSLLAAAGFLHELTRAVNRIREAPHRYARAEHGTRRILLDRFPFSIYYRVTDEAVVIVAVAHAKRRPRYWSGR